MRTLFVFMSLALSGSALAQSNELDLDAGSTSDGFVIVGREHLPDFTVLIERENLSKAYDLKLTESFLPKIIKAIKDDPF